MNQIEDRLREAYTAAAGTVRPEAIRGLRNQPPRPPHRRLLVPLAAAAAVAAVIAAVSLITPLVLSGHHRPAAPPRASPGSPTSSPSSSTSFRPPASATASASAAPTRPHPAPGGPGGTQVIDYRPWTPTGLAAGIKVASTRSGSCWESSVATVRRDAYRCTAGNEIFDPCFARPGARNGTRQVACASPGPAYVTIINLTRPLPPPFTSQAQLSPWLIVLRSGQWCFDDTGATLEIAGQRANFGCQHGFLFGEPDQSRRTWTILYQPSRTASLRPAPIAKAYE